MSVVAGCEGTAIGHDFDAEFHKRPTTTELIHAPRYQCGREGDVEAVAAGRCRVRQSVCGGGVLVSLCVSDRR